MPGAEPLEPPPSRCGTMGCNAEVPATGVSFKGRSMWVRTPYCANCRAVKDATPAPDHPRSAREPGPRPSSRKCLHDGCLNQVHAELIGDAFKAWVFSVECPGCRHRTQADERQNEYLERLHASQLPTRYAGFTFERRLMPLAGESIMALVARVAAQPEPHVGIAAYLEPIARMMRSWSPGERSIYLWGPVGGGKTTLVAALLNRIMRDGTDVLYVPEARLLESVRLLWRAEKGAKVMDVPAMAARAPVLALDDIGATERPSTFEKDAFERVICHRYDRNLPIICTSNIRLNSSDKRESTVASIYGERVMSRLTQMCGQPHEVVGFDWRTRQAHDVSDRIVSVSQVPLLIPKVHDRKAAAAGERDDD